MSVNSEVNGLYVYYDQYGNQIMCAAASRGEADAAALRFSNTRGWGYFFYSTERPPLADEDGPRVTCWPASRLPQTGFEILVTGGDAGSAIYAVWPTYPPGPLSASVELPPPPGTTGVTKLYPVDCEGLTRGLRPAPLANAYYRDIYSLLGPVHLYKYLDESDVERCRDAVQLVMANDPNPAHYAVALMRVVSTPGGNGPSWSESPGLPRYTDEVGARYNMAPSGAPPMHGCAFDHEFLW